MQSEFEEIVAQALMEVVDPCSIATGTPVNIVDMGLVKDVHIDNGECSIALRVTSPLCMQIGNIVEAVERCVSAALSGGRVHCRVDPDWDWLPDMMAAEAHQKLRALRPIGQSSASNCAEPQSAWLMLPTTDRRASR